MVKVFISNPRKQINIVIDLLSRLRPSIKEADNGSASVNIKSCIERLQIADKRLERIEQALVD